MVTIVNNVLFGLLGALLLASLGANGIAAERDLPARLWTSNKGTLLMATLVRVQEEDVVLRKEDGSEITVPMKQLSKLDQEYVKIQISGIRKGQDDRARGSGTSAGDGETSELEQRCQRLCEQLTKTYKGAMSATKPTIAVVEFADLSGRVTDVGRLVSEELITKLFSTGNYKVIERFLLNKAIDEHKLTLQGIVDPKSAKELGKILGVDAIVSGTIADMSDSLRVNARLISTQTGEVLSVAAVTIPRASVPADGPRSSARSSRSRGKVQLPFREDFSGYEDGQETNWGDGGRVKTGADGRKWLIPSGSGQKPVGLDVDVLQNAYIEFDYDAQALESNRAFGRVLSGISLIDETGAKYRVEWTVEEGPAQPGMGRAMRQPFSSHPGSHTLKLPGGASERVVHSGAGTFRIAVEGNRVGVTVVDPGYGVASGMGTMGPGGATPGMGRRGTLSATVLDFKKFTRFEVDLYRGPNCALSITNIKVGRLPTSSGSGR